MRRPRRETVSTAAARGAAQLGRTVGVALSESELTPAAYRMLAYLASGDVAAKALATKLAVTPPTVTSTLDWLEPRGYITRTPLLSDRRRVEIAITERGRAALSEADERVVSRLANVLGRLDSSEASVIVHALEVLHDELNAYRAESDTGAARSRE